VDIVPLSVCLTFVPFIRRLDFIFDATKLHGSLPLSTLFPRHRPRPPWVASTFSGDPSATCKLYREVVWGLLPEQYVEVFSPRITDSPSQTGQPPWPTILHPRRQKNSKSCAMSLGHSVLHGTLRTWCTQCSNVGTLSSVECLRTPKVAFTSAERRPSEQNICSISL
jgi:hypothetical protein